MADTRSSFCIGARRTVRLLGLSQRTRDHFAIDSGGDFGIEPLHAVGHDAGVFDAYGDPMTPFVLTGLDHDGAVDAAPALAEVLSVGYIKVDFGSFG